MSERANPQRWAVIGLAILGLFTVVLGVAQHWLGGGAVHPPTISTQPQIRETVNATWSKRNSINNALIADALPASTSPQPQSKAKASPKAGNRFQAVAAQITSPALRTILGLDGNGTYQARREALSKLKRPLPSSDQQWLYAFLASSASIEGLSPQAQDALKDGLMVYLMGDSSSLSATVEVLRQIYLDPSQDPIIRNYAVQYLANAVLKLTDVGQKSAIQEILLTSARDSSSETSGAALLGLNRLSEYGYDPNTSLEVRQIALANASNQNLSQMDRITPLQLCGQNNVVAAAPVARDLAVNSNQAMVKMVALATLGQVGNAGDIPLLTKSSTDPDVRIQKAASVALARLETKLRQ